MKSPYFNERQRPLEVLGPTASADFPSTTQLLRSLFAKPDGIYRYLSAYLPADAKVGADAYALLPRDIEIAEKIPKDVFQKESLKVSALRQHHGNSPALAWRVQTGGASIVFSGDTDGRNLELIADTPTCWSHTTRYPNPRTVGSATCTWRHRA